jgi:hypothetical protein
MISCWLHELPAFAQPPAPWEYINMTFSFGESHQLRLTEIGIDDNMADWYTLGVAFFAAIGTFLFV